MKFDIKFRAFRFGDEKFINKLRENDLRERKVGGMKRYVSLDREAKWVQDIIFNDNQTCIYLAITPIDSDEIIGYTSISDIDYRNGTCFWSGIKLSPSCTGKGYGHQVAILVLRYVFEELRMVRCVGMCQESHVAAINLMEKAGFVQEGVMRKYMYKNGEHINELLYSILDNEYITLKNRIMI